MFKFPILRTLILDVKQSVKHIVRIDNTNGIHISSYSLIVISYVAYTRNETLHSRTIPAHLRTLQSCCYTLICYRFWLHQKLSPESCAPLKWLTLIW